MPVIPHGHIDPETSKIFLTQKYDGDCAEHRRSFLSVEFGETRPTIWRGAAVQQRRSDKAPCLPFIVEVSLYSCTMSHSKQGTKRRQGANAEHTLAKPSARQTSVAFILTFQLVEGPT
jgi:hypothetical protein